MKLPYSQQVYCRLKFGGPMLTKGITTGKALLMAIGLAFSLAAQAEDDSIRDEFFDKEDDQLPISQLPNCPNRVNLHLPPYSLPNKLNRFKLVLYGTRMEDAILASIRLR
jgi:hypothetical protein